MRIKRNFQNESTDEFSESTLIDIIKVESTWKLLGHPNLEVFLSNVEDGG